MTTFGPAPTDAAADAIWRSRVDGFFEGDLLSREDGLPEDDGSAVPAASVLGAILLGRTLALHCRAEADRHDNRKLFVPRQSFGRFRRSLPRNLAD
jgi:hypothetical protein